MPKWGSFKFDDFKRLANSFQKSLDEKDIDRFIRDFLLEMAYEAEEKMKKRTPVDTGNLRRNWQVGKVERQGDSYFVEIDNKADYASSVEYGYRADTETGEWIEGHFMMTISAKEIERELPKYLKKRQKQLLEQIVKG